MFDLDLIVDTIDRYFGIQLKPIDRPMYKKSYLEWVDILVPLPREYKTFEFSTFFREDGKSTMKHIERFTLQCGEGKPEWIPKDIIVLFIVDWKNFMQHSSLPQNSIQYKAYIQRCFCDIFYLYNPIVTTTNLMNLRQQIDESAVGFIERFRKKLVLEPSRFEELWSLLVLMIIKIVLWKQLKALMFYLCVQFSNHVFLNDFTLHLLMFWQVKETTRLCSKIVFWVYWTRSKTRI